MKDIVLDTNVIIDDPTILAQSREDVRLIIPSAVLTQVESLSAARQSRLPGLIRSAASADKVMIVPSSHLPLIVHTGPQGLDYVDLDVLSVALQSKANNPGTILATKDRDLQLAATQNGLDVVDVDGLRALLSSAIAPDPTILAGAKSVTRRLWFDLAINGIVALAASIIALLLNNYWGTVVPYFVSVAGVTGMAVAGTVLFFIRSRWRLAYGITEFSVGIILTYDGVSSALTQQSVAAIEIIKLSSGLYVMVRALDNFGKGLKGRSWESKWKRVFPD